MLEAATTIDYAADMRWKQVEATMRRNGYQPDALIETLHTVQELFGYIDENALRFITSKLPISPSKALGVVTFYHYFQMKPAGKHTISMCTGTACHIKGGEAILEEICERYNLHPGETTPDGKVSLLTVRCIGACGLAPAAVFDGEVVGNLSVEKVREQFDKWMAEEDDEETE
ncbi:MAG: NAD(P)H-dependent oxidoreductase subunit E [Anaerolineales bacterium]|nr:NAD(P)H-dependent oxidoreductase subunit E [Anaerolineales bacterium]